MNIIKNVIKRFTPFTPVHEMCGHCLSEVKLKNRFEMQTCPNCNEHIMPCSICEHKDKVHYDSCDTCPLKK